MPALVPLVVGDRIPDPERTRVGRFGTLIPAFVTVVAVYEDDSYRVRASDGVEFVLRDAL